jgi:hypothetical protein
MFGEVQGIARRGSNDRNVDTSSIFDVGFLRNVLLLPPEVNIGYNNIISAGQLGHLRTVQDADGQFYVLNSAGDVISKGHVGDDNIFYLDDLNFLLSAPNTPGSVRPTSNRRLMLFTRRNVEFALFVVIKSMLSLGVVQASTLRG